LLNRVISWTPECIRYEADQRLSEILIREFGFNGSKGVDTPSSQQNRICNDEEDNTELHTGAPARCNFLGLDRPDVQYAAKEVSRGMANPTNRDLLRLKRLVRYLAAHPRLVFEFPFGSAPKSLQVLYMPTGRDAYAPGNPPKGEWYV